MGAFRKPKYQETAADKAVREDIERRRKEELKQQGGFNGKTQKNKK